MAAIPFSRTLCGLSRPSNKVDLGLHSVSCRRCARPDDGTAAVGHSDRQADLVAMSKPGVWRQLKLDPPAACWEMIADTGPNPETNAITWP